MLRIRLTRRGAKKVPHYRVVVSEKSSPRDGRFKEIVGYYNPAADPVLLKLDLDRIDYWLQNGAQPSETVKTLIKRSREMVAAPVEEAETVEASQEAKPEVEAEDKPDESEAEETSEEKV